MDFTLTTYRQLLQSLQDAGFSFLTFSEYIESYRDSGSPASEAMRDEKLQDLSASTGTGSVRIDGNHSRYIILRHDVDLLPQNSLAFARIQHEMGIKGSYYFRAVPESWDEAIIKEIHSLGHEVGYHYEDVDRVKSLEFRVKSGESEELKAKSLELGVEDFPASEGTGNVRVHSPSQGSNPESRIPNSPNNETRQQWSNEALIDAAIISFQENLEKLRRLVPVTTICMHGSPRSKYDNRDLWKKYDYRDFGILGEPYFDMDFDDVFYLTDTGRRWDGWRVSVRDKVPQQERWIGEGLVFRSTGDIIERVKSLEFRVNSLELTQPQPEPQPQSRIVNRSRDFALAQLQPFPSKIMMTFHPQRWTDNPYQWLRELILQNAKNQVKRFLVKR